MIYLQDQDFTLHQGDALEVLRSLPDESVHTCVTSPPFYGLRDYAVDGQIGLEATPDEYVARLVDVFREVRRVLRRDGTCWVELGDSYATSANNNAYHGKGPNTSGLTNPDYQDRSRTTGIAPPPGVKPKDLLGIPWLVAFALRADGWWLRSDIVWARPNPMPESVTDRPTKSHSYVFLFAKSARYFFDQEAIREPHQLGPNTTHVGKSRPGYVPPGIEATTDPLARNGRGFGTNPDLYHPAGRNVRSVWTIPTQPLPDEHYAAFPERLAERCILAGTSERGVCPECGAPWQRVVESELVKSPVHGTGSTVRSRGEGDPNGWAGEVYPRLNRKTTTTGWQPTCTHAAEPVPATVLDPFVGSGTTALVARRHGRKTIGIELSPTYCAIAARRTQQLALYS